MCKYTINLFTLFYNNINNTTFRKQIKRTYRNAIIIKLVNLKTR